ncbi:MAG: hypothetical protein Q4D38_07020 [Planctomycetia bacterium]|nr:hypothetical protein [Planctomycetia bacterium]
MMRAILTQIIIILLLLLAGFIGFLIYTRHQGSLSQRIVNLSHENDRLSEEKVLLTKENTRLGEENERLDLANQYLKVDHRIAGVEVLEQTLNEDGTVAESRIRFTEFYPSSSIKVPPREFIIQGDRLYVEALVVKFDDHFVEENDALRNRSLYSFQRIFGEHQKPSDGFRIDEENSIPTVYKSEEKEPSQLEKEIWANFWRIANDPEEQKRLGIRANHAEAPSVKLEKGNRYTLQIRSSDGLSMKVGTPE